MKTGFRKSRMQTATSADASWSSMQGKPFGLTLPLGLSLASTSPGTRPPMIHARPKDRNTFADMTHMSGKPVVYSATKVAIHTARERS
jgi:hypothetical protein